jgi:hypothetical protein
MRVFDYFQHFENLEDPCSIPSIGNYRILGNPTRYNDHHDRYIPSDSPANEYIYSSEDDADDKDSDEDDEDPSDESIEHKHFVNASIHSIRRAMLRIDEGEPAIIGWRRFDCYDPWVGLYQWNAYCNHGHGDMDDVADEQPRTRYLMSVMKKYLAAAWRDGSGGPIAVKNNNMSMRHNTKQNEQNKKKSNGFEVTIISSTWKLSSSS